MSKIISVYLGRGRIAEAIKSYIQSANEPASESIKRLTALGIMAEQAGFALGVRNNELHLARIEVKSTSIHTRRENHPQTVDDRSTRPQSELAARVDADAVEISLSEFSATLLPG